MKTLKQYDRLAAGEYDGHFTVDGYKGIAFYVRGWEVEPIAMWSCDCGACGFDRDSGGGKTLEPHTVDCEAEEVYYSDEPEYERTGNLIAIMVGDDRDHVVDPSDLTPLKRSEFCGECGQVGCHCDGYPQDDE